MSESSKGDNKALTSGIRESLANAESKATSLKTRSSWLLFVSIVTSAASTFVAAFAVAQGPVVGEGIPGWRTTCIITALFSFATTVCVGLNQQFGMSDRVSKANECAGKLKSLDVAIATGSRDWEDIGKEYEAIVKEYPEEIRANP